MRRTNDLLSGLAKLSDFVVYDSSRLTAYSKSVDAIRDCDDNQLNAGCFCRDIGWRRTERWRTLITEQFDSERVQVATDRIQSLRITYRKGCGVVAGDALLLAGWFYSALGWSTRTASKTEEGVSVSCKRPDGNEAVIEFVESSAEPEGDVSADSLDGVDVVFESASGSFLRVRVSRSAKDESAQVSTEFSEGGEDHGGTCDICLRRAPLPLEAQEELLVFGLTSFDRPQEYLRALDASVTIGALVDARS